MSIVADVSLGLELSAELVRDADLYGHDLGQRREALLRNWGRLHELRSAPPGKTPSPRALRLEVESEALTALAFALTAGAGLTDPGGARVDQITPRPRERRSEPASVSRAELRLFGAELTRTLRMRQTTVEQAAAELAISPDDVARWAAGKELPSEPEARALDEYLTARGAIQNIVIGLRSRPDRPGPRLVPVPRPSPAAPTLLQTFGSVAAALRDCRVRDAGGRPLGWPGDLRDLQGEATPASTAYGIKTMMLLEDGLAADLVPVAENLKNMALDDGGFASRRQYGRPRPETTAVVLNALRRIAATEDFGKHVTTMEKGLGDFEKSRPFILTTVLETSLLLEPGGRLVETLVDSLLAARRSYGDLLLWPEKAEALLIDPDPSVAHTARAVRVLASVQAVRPSSSVQEALEQATAWLIEQRDLHNAYEATERGLEMVHIRHLTAAWVVKALISVGVPTTHPTVSSALAQLWNSYGGDTAALWAWDNGDLPIWMTFDAVEALRLANLAVPVRPGWSPA